MNMLYPSMISTPFVILSGCVSVVGYAYLASLAGEALAPAFPEDRAITAFVLTTTALFLVYGTLCAKILRGETMSRYGFCAAVGLCFLFRLILLPTDLILENDIYRYLWDGHVWHQGINPFQYPPDDPALEAIHTAYWSRINYPYIPTIYPPTLQYVFYAVYGLFPNSVTGMKVVLLGFDAATVGLLILVLKKRAWPKEWSLIYAWSPLVIQEIANSGHADAVSAFLLVCVILFWTEKRRMWCAAAMALFVLTKFFGILLLPLFLRDWRVRDYAFCGCLIGLLYLPFIQPGVNVFQGFITFSNEWRFNAGLFALLESLLIQFKLAGYFQSDAITRKLMGGVILLVTIWQSVRMYRQPSIPTGLRAMLIIVGTLLMCSPVINVWYMVWILPLICLQPGRAWIVFTALIFLSYTYYYQWMFMDWVKPLEFGLFFLLFVDEIIWNTVSDGVYRQPNPAVSESQPRSL